MNSALREKASHLPEQISIKAKHGRPKKTTHWSQLLNLTAEDKNQASPALASPINNF